MVSIIILSYNTEKLLFDCLTSVTKHIAKNRREVIVVDNASTDGSAAMVRHKFPDVILIENKKNLGFAGGCNLGARTAKGDFLLFLNSDTIVTHDVLPVLQSGLENDEKVAVVGGNLQNADGTYQLSYGKFHTIPILVHTLFLGGERRSIRISSHSPHEVDWVTGACMFVRKSVFDYVNGFDEKYFMYMEDMDLCYRLHKLGYKMLFMPEAKILHKGQGSSNRTFAIVHIYEGLLHFYKTQKSFPEYIVVLLMLYVKATVAVCVGIATRNTYLVETYRKAIQF